MKTGGIIIDLESGAVIGELTLTETAMEFQTDRKDLLEILTEYRENGFIVFGFTPTRAESKRETADYGSSVKAVAYTLPELQQTLYKDSEGRFWLEVDDSELDRVIKERNKLFGNRANALKNLLAGG